MAIKVKVIDSGFNPGEGKAYQVGDTFLLEDPMPLVREGKVVVVDEDGNEVAPPGIKYTCPICNKSVNVMSEFVDHMDTHKGITTSKKEPVTTTVAEVENTRGSAEPNTVAPVEETVSADLGKAGEQGKNADGSPVDPRAQRMAEIRAKRLQALTKARQVRAEKNA